VRTGQGELDFGGLVGGWGGLKWNAPLGGRGRGGGVSVKRGRRRGRRSGSTYRGPVARSKEQITLKVIVVLPLGIP